MSSLSIQKAALVNRAGSFIAFPKALIPDSSRSNINADKSSISSSESSKSFPAKELRPFISF
uniref:Uncharacterized protein n=1 Tax=Podoviridae sp. ct8Lf7 TaxID=2827723 RepID=A0A8S5S195_9CAUD|nr:MAG TPA: hypothetical protein [Podoviridae sp. ct8Lf7]